MTREKETAAEVFERINRRRAPVDVSGALDHGQGTMRTAQPTVEPLLRAPEEVPFRTSPPSGSRSPASTQTTPGSAGLHGALDPIARPDPRTSADPLTARAADPVADPILDTAADSFPRSATMRLILKHPALALGLGLPAAGLLLKSAASRRLLGMAVRVGTGPELQTLLRLSASSGRGQTPR